MDGGRTWNTVTDSPYPYLSFVDARTGWAGSPSSLAATSDGGESWKTTPSPTADKGIAVVALRSPVRGYILDEDGNIFVTEDGGGSWEARSLGLPPGEHLPLNLGGPQAAMRFKDERNGIVVFDISDGTVRFAVIKDGGVSWQRAEIPEQRGQSLYYKLYLSYEGQPLTVTDDFNNGKNVSIVLRYRRG